MAKKKPQVIVNDEVVVSPSARSTVKFFPEKDSALAGIAERENRESLSAAVESENEDGTINVIVNVPLGENVLVQDVSSDPKAAFHFEDVL